MTRRETKFITRRDNIYCSKNRDKKVWKKRTGWILGLLHDHKEDRESVKDDECPYATFNTLVQLYSNILLYIIIYIIIAKEIIIQFW